MAKRPSAASTRSKQHQVLRYIYTTDLKTTAKDYNVSTEKLRQFVLGNPRRLKSRVQKDPSLRHLYETDVKEIAKKNKEKLIPRLTRKRYFELAKRERELKIPLTSREVRSREYRTVTKTREYQVSKKGKVSYRKLSERQVEMQQVRTELAIRDLSEFTNKNAVKQGLADGLLSPADVRRIVALWQETYSMEEDAADEVLDEVMEEYVEEDASEE